MDFTLDDVFLVGYHLVKFLNVDRVLVGHDDRISSPDIFDMLTRGIRFAGADVYSIGSTTTPMLYYATFSKDFHASVMITASHNSAEYNGLKISREHAQPIGYDTGLAEIERRMQEDEVVRSEFLGDLISLQIEDEYLNFLHKHARGLKDLNVAIDCSNGMAGLLVHKLFPDSYHYLYDTVDCRFPHHDPNPLVESNSDQLKDLIREKRCDAGMIFDGDGDRVVFLDEQGEFIPPDLMIAVMGLHFLNDNSSQGEHVVVDIRTSKAVAEFLEPRGAIVEPYRVGRAYMATRLRELKGLYGGELAGHYYFRDFHYSDSGLLAALILLGVVADLKKQGKTLGGLIKEIKTYSNSGELNFNIEDKKGAMDAVRDHFIAQEEPVRIMDIDGYRVEFKEWWFNIRPSNTEPLLRFVGEAHKEDILKEKLKQLQDVLTPYIK